MVKEVRANCFCASLLRTKIHSPRHARERALSHKMNNDRQMAIAIALPGIIDLRRSVTCIFLLLNHFLYGFSTFSEKMEESYRLEN